MYHRMSSEMSLKHSIASLWYALGTYPSQLHCYPDREITEVTWFWPPDAPALPLLPLTT